jgi:ketosteroid isomerase-like protein
MSTENERRAREGYEALMRGEVEALEQLLAPDLTWHWWEHGPWDCHSREDAVAVIEERIEQRAVGELVEVSEVAPGRVLVVTRMRPDSEIGAEDLGRRPGHVETANLVTFRHGRVTAMHDYRTRDEAVRALARGRHGG